MKCGWFSVLCTSTKELKTMMPAMQETAKVAMRGQVSLVKWPSDRFISALLRANHQVQSPGGTWYLKARV